MSEPQQSSAVFIVDDEAVIRDAVRLVVANMGHSVECFSSAAEFLEFIKPYDVSGPACLIADVQMPRVNGLELLEQLSTLDKKLPVVMITGHGTKSLKQKAESLGAAVFLEKPFRPTELQEVVATLLKQDTDEHDVA